MSLSQASFTADSVLGGALKIVQPRQGYRFSLEALLLARFISPGACHRVLELGAGCGVSSLLVAHLHHPREVVAIEFEPRMANLAKRNFELNRIHNCTVLCADLRQRKIAGADAGSFDYVIMNPPYGRKGAGRESPEPTRRAARSEVSATLEEFLAASARYLRAGGRAAVVFTARRATELIDSMRRVRLEPKRLRAVHGRLDLPASVILVEGRKNGGVELRIEPPLILYTAPGLYTDEAKELLGIDARQRDGSKKGPSVL